VHGSYSWKKQRPFKDKPRDDDDDDDDDDDVEWRFGLVVVTLVA